MFALRNKSRTRFDCRSNRVLLLWLYFVALGLFLLLLGDFFAYCLYCLKKVV